MDNWKSVENDLIFSRVWIRYSHARAISLDVCYLYKRSISNDHCILHLQRIFVQFYKKFIFIPNLTIQIVGGSYHNQISHKNYHNLKYSQSVHNMMLSCNTFLPLLNDPRIIVWLTSEGLDLQVLFLWWKLFALIARKLVLINE